MPRKFDPKIAMAKNAGYVQPSESDVHVDRPLTNISIAFMQSQDDFVAGRVFPGIPVMSKSDAYYVIDRAEFFRSQAKRRAPGTRAPQINWKVSTDNYNSNRESVANPVPDEIRANADGALGVDRAATELVTEQGLLKQELDFVTNYFTAGNPGDTWTYDVDGAATASGAFDPTSAANNNKVFWDDAASTPIEDIRQGKRFVQSRTAKRPNVLVLGRNVFDVLLDHPDIVGRLDRGQTTGPAIVQREALAALFELEEILVMDGIQNSAAEGLTASYSFIGGNNALLAYRPPNPGLLVPSAGYTFNWTGFLGATTNGMRIRRKRDDLADTDLFEMDMHYDQKLVSADLGYFFGGIVQ